MLLDLFMKYKDNFAIVIDQEKIKQHTNRDSRIIQISVDLSLSKINSYFYNYQLDGYIQVNY